MTAVRALALAVYAEPGYGPVADAFAANFERHGEIGAAFCLYVAGHPVVDAVGGLADAATGRPWCDDTMVPVFSVTKGVTAVLVHLLAERGLLELDAPVARYWPEFAAAGKHGITLRQVMSHTAGVPAVDADLTLAQVLAWDPVVRAIAGQAPDWPAGTAVGYHAKTYGWVLGEVVRRVTGRSLGRCLSDELAEPLGLDFWVGLPAALEARVAVLVPDAASGTDGGGADCHEAGSLPARALRGPSELFRLDGMWNRRELHAAELPSSNGIGDARSLARLYAAVLGGVDGAPPLLAPPTVQRARRVEAQGLDAVLGVPARIGTGFELGDALGPGVGPDAFGHTGAGGSVAWADPAGRVAFAYVCNRLHLRPGPDPRAAGLARAVYAVLGTGTCRHQPEAAGTME